VNWEISMINIDENDKVVFLHYFAVEVLDMFSVERPNFFNETPQR